MRGRVAPQRAILATAVVAALSLVACGGGSRAEPHQRTDGRIENFRVEQIQAVIGAG